MDTFRELTVWKKSHQLTLAVYKITKNFPVEERFGLVSQMRRASSSIPSNLAEGFKRSSAKEKAHYINIAEGSLEEVKYQLILSRDLDYLHQDAFQELFDQSEEIGRMLNAYRRAILQRTDMTSVLSMFIPLILIPYTLYLIFQ